ncbi:hypothetical protein [Ileibacterium valens]|uniref:hypothetical protein n=1 Tax=Ileibacterium valens TaxID=1862668 RepID=UPI00272F3A87|nr:hypothetical protein [Ileibacterium valens]
MRVAFTRKSGRGRIVMIYGIQQLYAAAIAQAVATGSVQPVIECMDKVGHASICLDYETDLYTLEVYIRPRDRHESAHVVTLALPEFIGLELFNVWSDIDDFE